MASVPLYVLAAAGVNTTVSVAELPAAIVVMPDAVNTALLLLMLEIVALAVPVFVIVMLWVPLPGIVTLPNESDVELACNVATGAAVPVPFSATACVLLLALSVIVNVPVRAPVAVGVNVTLMLQLAPAASVAPQVFVEPKSPVTEIELMLRLAVPVFESVTACVALVVFTTWLANVKPVAEILAAGTAAEPEPLTPIFIVGLFALLVTDTVPL
jgi:hypothetical protein